MITKPHSYIHSLLFVVLSFIVLQSAAQEHVQFDMKTWKHKQNREEFAMIFSGKVDKAISKMVQYEEKNGVDPEVLYGLSVAYYSKHDTSEGFNYFIKAIDAGFPIERFMAGPRGILGPLYQNEHFRELIKRKELIHGPMTGAVTSHSAKVWIRTFSGVHFKISVALDSLMSNIVGVFQGQTIASDDFTGIVRIVDLQADTKYFYTLQIDDELVAGILSFATFSVPEVKGSLRVAFGGGAFYNPRLERIWSVIEKQRPSFFIGMGDNVYIDHPKLPEVQKFCYYQRESSLPFRRMLSSVPYYSVWDDHDFGVNDSYGGKEKNIPAWKPDVLKVYKENTLNPYYAGGQEQPGTWYNFSAGDVDFFMLDTRYYRTPSTDNEPNMLGEEQMKWLKEKLKNSSAAFKVLVSSVPWSDGAKDSMEGRFDTWRGYPAERDEIFNFLTQNDIEGVILLSADRHRHDAWKHERKGDYALYEFTSSRLTNIHYHELRKDALFGYNEKCGFGMLEFYTNVRQPYMVFKIINIDNECIDQIRIYLHQLSSRSR
ncbi:MAG: alkaline phosphatase D family protein [Bacteroidales bacterium]|nr:alkaline phosphatase D family protein [Bacteroidales bacterium]